MLLMEKARFESQQYPGRSVDYIVLNAGAPHTLQYCYGAGGTAMGVNLYSEFVQRHPMLSIICIERWCQGVRMGEEQGVLTDLTSIAGELLRSRSITEIGIASHSAGIYQALAFAQQFPSMVTSIFPICAHIPAALTGSDMMVRLTKAPNYVLHCVGKLDSMTLPKSLARLVGQIPSQFDETIVYTQEAYDLVQSLVPSDGDLVAQTKNRKTDYSLCYEKLDGYSGQKLLDLYTSCPIDFVWLTTTGDSFFGPTSVRRVADRMTAAKVEIVEFNTTTHANIYYQTAVWEFMYSRLVRE